MRQSREWLWVLLVVAGLAWSGCVSKDVRDTAELAAGRSEEYVEASKMTHEEVMGLVDPSATLETILADPLGALCSWVRIQGEVLEPDVVDEYWMDDDYIYLGRVDEAAGVYKVLRVSTMGADPSPVPGDRVDVVGKVFCTQVQLEKNGRDVEAFEESHHQYRLLTWGVVVLD